MTFVSLTGSDERLHDMIVDGKESEGASDEA
jgi:hypothetical protein